ncbi:MAG: fused MFS/spermidine synthase [candidate division FCPU426 bacterium]
MSLLSEKRVILATAFLEGLACLVIEIAGARALAPYFGASLAVWTAQITATLLFLAIGYGLGGVLSRSKGDWKLPTVFWAAGIWLAIFPLLRGPLLASSVAGFGVAFGSFVSSAVLFGLPLVCLGAVSPFLIARLDAAVLGAGSAAGSIFFVNTLGGLLGGWLTALVLIPMMPLRLAMAACGILLVLVGTFWSLRLRRSRFSAVAAPLAALMFLPLAPSPARSLGSNAHLLVSLQSHTGLIQIIDVARGGRMLMNDGIVQGGMDKETGISLLQFTDYQNFMAQRYHPKAQSALVLGLGTGMLAKGLDARGIKVTVVELDPNMEGLARDWFGLPSSVRVLNQDARAWLNKEDSHFDLIFLDAFVGEVSPWYLATREGIARMKDHLNPGGRVVINSVTRAKTGSEGLARLEAVLVEVFGEARVSGEHWEPKGQLVNATLVAGKDLKPTDEAYKGKTLERNLSKLPLLVAEERAALPGRFGTDDFSDLDYVESRLRSEWRKQVVDDLGPDFLAN